MTNSFPELSITAHTVFDDRQLKKLAEWRNAADALQHQVLSNVDRAFVSFLTKQNETVKRLIHNKKALEVALKGLVKELGSRKELLSQLETIDYVVRFYLGLLGFRNANKVSIHVMPKPTEVFGRPGSVHLVYRQAVQTLHAMKDLLSSPDHIKKLDGQEKMGLLILSLIFRDGVLNSAELLMCLNEMAHGRVLRHEGLCYVFGPVARSGVHLRRAHLSGLTAALSTQVPEKKYAQADLDKALKAIYAQLTFKESCPEFKVKTLISAGQHYFRVAESMPQFVVDYASNNLASESLEETCFARLLGVTPNPLMIEHEQKLRVTGHRTRERSRPYSLPGHIRDFSSACTKNKNRKTAHNAAVFAAENALQDKSISQLDRLFLKWALWMLEVRALAASTTASHFLTLYRPMQATIDDANFDITTLSSDSWDQLVEEMTRGRNARDNLFDAVVQMTHYLNYVSSGSFKHSGYADAAIVNAYVISRAEKDEAFSILETKYAPSKPFIAEQAKFAIELAYHLGLRRWEFLGLKYRDVKGTLEPMLVIKDNDIRAVKTDSSNRQVPLNLVSSSDLYKMWREQCEVAKDEKTKSIIEAMGFDPARQERALFDAINDVLYEVTGSKEVTFHTLRHSAVSRLLLGIFWDTLNLKELESVTYFKEIADDSLNIRQLLVRKHTENFSEHKTVSAVIGHLSFATTVGHYFHCMDLLRWAKVKDVNKDSLLPDSPDHMLLVTNLEGSEGQSIAEVLDHIETNFPTKFVRHSISQKRKLDFNGLDLRQKLQVLGEAILLKPEDRSEYLKTMIEDDAKRDQYIVNLNIRIEYVESTLKDLKQWIKKDGGFLVMPQEKTIQIEILEILNRLKTQYPNNTKLREFSIFIPRAIESLRLGLRGVFTFKKDEKELAVKTLAPILEILDSDTRSVEYFYEYSYRDKSLGKVTKLKEHDGTVKTLDDIMPNPNNRGSLNITLKFGNSKTTPQRALIWTMASVFVAYGKSDFI